MGIKLTQTNRRCGNSRHNSRTSHGRDQEHIDERMTQYNINMVAINGKLETISPSEIDFFSDLEMGEYSRVTRAHLMAQNEKYKKKSHYDKMMSTRDMYESRRYAPLETIVQIGKMDDDVIDTSSADDRKKFADMVNVYVAELSKYSNVLSVCIHYDEQTAHAHIRHIMTTRDGRVAQDKALAERGFGLVNPEKKQSQYNNRMCTFTAEMRRKWAKIVQKFIPEIDFDLISDATRSKKHLDKISYITMEREKKLDRINQKIVEKSETMGLLDDIASMDADIERARARKFTRQISR